MGTEAIMSLDDPARPGLLRCDDVRVAALRERWRGCNVYSLVWRCYFHDRAGAWLRGTDGDHPLDAHRLYLIPPLSPYITDQTGEQHQLFVHFATRGALEWATPGIYPCDADTTLTLQADRLLERLRVQGRATARDQLEAERIVAGCLLQLPPDCWRDRAGDDRVSASISATMDHLEQPIDVAALARAQGLTRTAFIRRFKRETGETPLRHLNGLKIDQARRWLEEGRRGIDDIAQALGYVDRSHFSRLFRQMVGQPPAAYRDSWRG